MSKKNSSNQFKKLFASLAIPAIALFLLTLSEKECAAQNPVKTVHPLFFIDDKEVENSSLTNLNPDDIHSFSILKSNEEIIEKYGKLYGVKTSQGIISVITKAYAAQHANPDSVQTVQILHHLQQQAEKVPKQEEVKESESLSSKLNINTADKPLIIVDGEEVADMDNLRAEDIHSMSILKDRSAIKVYGEKGKNGVILITTKKGKE